MYYTSISEEDDSFGEFLTGPAASITSQMPVPPVAHPPSTTAQSKSETVTPDSVNSQPTNQAHVSPAQSTQPPQKGELLYLNISEHVILNSSQISL